jgi:hypothetical protein
MLRPPARSGNRSPDAYIDESTPLLILALPVRRLLAIIGVLDCLPNGAPSVCHGRKDVGE